MPVYIGLDLGTSSVKALAVDPLGQTLAQATAGYPVQRPSPGFAEQDPDAWWKAAASALSEVAASVPSQEIAALAVCGQTHGTVLLDEADQCLAPAIIWSDQRSAEQAERLLQERSAAWFNARSGGVPSTGFQISTLCWIRENLPELWSRVRRVALPKDHLRWRLTGEWCTDPSDACGTGLLDVAARDWSDELISLAGARREHFPRVLPSAKVVGHLQPSAAGMTGLPAGLPVVNGGGDTPCSALAAGALGPDVLLITLSTGGQMVWPTNTVATELEGRAYTCCAAAPNPSAAGWYLLGGPLAAGSALQWGFDLLGASSREAAADLVGKAADVPAGAAGITFLPRLAGERTPRRDPAARGVFSGLAFEHGPAEIVRAIMEGVALACREGFDSFRCLGASPGRLILGGGGARYPLWRKIFADTFQLPVFPLAAQEQSAFGAAQLAAAALGQSLACDQQEIPPILPDPTAAPAMDEAFNRYRRWAENSGT